MKPEVVCKLKEYVKESKSFGYSFYWKTEPYKNLSEIYESDKVSTADILCEIALSSDPKTAYDNENIMSIIECIILQHGKNSDEVRYLKSKYKNLVKTVFESNNYSKCRSYFDYLSTVGIDPEVELESFKKNLKTETDAANISRLKYLILVLELCREFPKQRGFLFPTGRLELNEMEENTAKKIQNYINIEIELYGIDIVEEYIDFFLAHRYAKETSKKVLKQMKVECDATDGVLDAIKKAL